MKSKMQVACELAKTTYEVAKKSGSSHAEAMFMADYARAKELAKK